ncbi:hypothetical protein E5347_16215 [Clostridium sartagoforme]|uniref:LXG domain-containing protein n=1 Tax=Clostridium sartagoforme TaxID=84031 RepID=A0A4S2DGI0_9CLOT|nr:hypothetical protein [Clostridium sartagoforme]TGY39943.1 hypothetical protein E5347_16215 [Clostridium sartagoforme]
MAESSLKIDDDYCKEVAEYFSKQGGYLDEYVKQYITILQGIKKDAIKGGDVAKALDAYIQYAKKLENQIGNISANAQQQAKNFIKAVDDADQYLF